ncbi:MAG: SPASM domain-containing protein [Pseudodesulfovibrio sp.]|nr:SPASM domain-containing protein [Pseudodesulfovibrio sp.]
MLISKEQTMQMLSLRQAFSGLDTEAKTRRYRELWHKAGRFEILPDYPLHLDLELSGVCNLHCSDCFQEALDKKKLGLMKTSLFQQLIDSGVPRGLCAIKLQIRGESFLHPDLFSLIRYAKDRGVLDVQITTNGTLIREDTVDAILHSGLDGIIFSVDVRHEDACSDTAVPQGYSHVPKMITALLERRKELGLTRPWVRLKASTDGSSPEVMDSLKKRLVEAFPLADIHIVGSIFNFKKDQDSYPELRKNYILNPCAYLMQRLAVFWDGQTTACCMDYHGDFGLPSVVDAPIETIWSSPQLEALRKGHLLGRRESLPICKHCHLSVESANERISVDETFRNKLDFELG